MDGQVSGTKPRERVLAAEREIELADLHARVQTTEKAGAKDVVCIERKGNRKTIRLFTETLGLTGQKRKMAHRKTRNSNLLVSLPAVVILGTLGCHREAAREQPMAARVEPAVTPTREKPASPELSKAANDSMVLNRAKARATFQVGLGRLARDKDADGARTEFLQAIEQDATYAEPRFNLGILAAGEEKWDEAIRWLEEFRRLDEVSELSVKAQMEIDRLQRARELDKTPEGMKERQAAGGADEAARDPTADGTAPVPVAPDGPILGRSFSVPELGTELIWIQPGTFTMGSPNDEEGRDGDEYQHTVEITKGFWLGKFEVTQGEYQVILGENPGKFKNVGLKAPVESVSWNMAKEFCAKLTDRERAAGRLPAGYEYTLPTEAQWEYSCRAGTSTAKYSNDLSDIAWFSGNSGKTTHVVGEKNRPNAWGLHDMIGNVWEWCDDWCGSSPSGPVKDPEGPNAGKIRVLRGGGWNGMVSNCRAARRSGYAPKDAFSILGFRLCLRSVTQGPK